MGPPSKNASSDEPADQIEDRAQPGPISRMDAPVDARPPSRDFLSTACGMEDDVPADLVEGVTASDTLYTITTSTPSPKSMPSPQRQLQVRTWCPRRRRPASNVTFPQPENSSSPLSPSPSPLPAAGLLKSTQLALLNHNRRLILELLLRSKDPLAPRLTGRSGKELAEEGGDAVACQVMMEFDKNGGSHCALGKFLWL